MEIKKWVHIKGPEAAKRLDNLNALAKKEKNGNFSALMNDSVNLVYHLDPVTGEQLPGKPPCLCGCCDPVKKRK